MLTELALLSFLAVPGSVSAKILKAKIPGHPAEISIEIPDFEPAEDPQNPDRMHILDALGENRPDKDSTLLFGGIHGDVWIWVSWWENFPVVSSDAYVKRFPGAPGFTAFSAQDTACLEFKLKDRGIVLQSLLEAFPESPDFMFAIRVVVESLTADDLLSGKRDADKFPRAAFTKMVRSFRVSGKAAREALTLPLEAYAFRDEAAKIAGDASAWVRKQCAARPDEWGPELYLGELARIQQKPELAAPAFDRAAGLLEARTDRDDKLNVALARACSGNAWALIRKQDFAGAIPMCDLVLGTAKPDAAGSLRGLRADALFDLACAYAQTRETEKAIQRLTEAVGLRPEWKLRARDEELLQPLRKTKEFESLVGK